jgi:hypothetical protein
MLTAGAAVAFDFAAGRSRIAFAIAKRVFSDPPDAAIDRRKGFARLMPA